MESRKRQAPQDTFVSPGQPKAGPDFSMNTYICSFSPEREGTSSASALFKERRRCSSLTLSGGAARVGPRKIGLLAFSCSPLSCAARIVDSLGKNSLVCGCFSSGVCLLARRGGWCQLHAPPAQAPGACSAALAPSGSAGLGVLASQLGPIVPAPWCVSRVLLRETGLGGSRDAPVPCLRLTRLMPPWVRWLSGRRQRF